jgi:Ca2+-transporting ATPase
VGAVALAIVFQLAIIYVPALNRLFGTAPLSASEVGLTLAGAVMVLLAVELEKKLARRRG